MSISYLSRAAWDYDRHQVFADATFDGRPRLFRCVVTVDYLTGGRHRPLREEEALRLFEAHRRGIEERWQAAARAAGPSDDVLTLSSAGVRAGRAAR